LFSIQNTHPSPPQPTSDTTTEALLVSKGGTRYREFVHESVFVREIVFIHESVFVHEIVFIHESVFVHEIVYTHAITIIEPTGTDQEGYSVSKGTVRYRRHAIY